VTTEDNSVIDREVLRCARELNYRLVEVLNKLVAEYDAAVQATFGVAPYRAAFQCVLCGEMTDRPGEHDCPEVAKLVAR